MNGNIEIQDLSHALRAEPWFQFADGQTTQNLHKHAPLVVQLMYKGYYCHYHVEYTNYKYVVRKPGLTTKSYGPKPTSRVIRYQGRKHTSKSIETTIRIIGRMFENDIGEIDTQIERKRQKDEQLKIRKAKISKIADSFGVKITQELTSPATLTFSMGRNFSISFMITNEDMDAKKQSYELAGIDGKITHDELKSLIDWFTTTPSAVINRLLNQ